jgi:hypothetical protein
MQQQQQQRSRSYQKTKANPIQPIKGFCEQELEGTRWKLAGMVPASQLEVL